MTKGIIEVLANIRLLPTSEGGKSHPIRGGSYRPNHNFFNTDNGDMAAGLIDLPQGTEIHPGDSAEVIIKFFYWPGLDGQIYPGREWRIQEGAQLVGMGTIIKIVSADL